MVDIENLAGQRVPFTAGSRIFLYTAVMLGISTVG